MSSTNRGGKRSEADYYPTPAWCVHQLLAAVPLPAGLWLEPAAGDGAIIEAVNRSRLDVQWRAIEVREPCRSDLERLVGSEGVRIDSFLSVAPRESFDVVITNPPYSTAMEMVEWSLSLRSKYVVMLLRLNFLATGRRAAFMRKHAPDVYVLPNRPSFSGRGTDSIEYAWFVWPVSSLPRVEGKLVVLPPLGRAARQSPEEQPLNPAQFGPAQRQLPLVTYRGSEPP